MSLKKGLTKTFGGKSKVQKSTSYLTLDNPEGWLTGDAMSLSTDKAMKVSTVNRCVEIRSNTIAVLPVYIMDEKTKERLSDHRLGKVLWGRANEAMTTFDYEKLQQVNRDLRGNAYTWIHRSKSTGYPEELIPLPPDYVSPYVDGRGKLWYIFFNPETGEKTKIPSVNILHYKAFSTDGLKGISILKRASQVIETAQSAQSYEQAMYDNGGRPSGVLTADTDLSGTKEITDEFGNKTTVRKKDYLRQEWERVHAGPSNSFRVAVLDLGLKYQPIAMTNADVQFVESSELRVADVCRFFGVPPHMVFAGKQSYQSNEQNSLEYVKYTLQPDVTQREQEDTHKLLLPSESGLRVRREMKVYLRGDTAAQASWYKSMRECGVYSTDDIRGLEDLGEVPGGDGRYASWNYGPLDKWSELSVIRALGKDPNQKQEG